MTYFSSNSGSTSRGESIGQFSTRASLAFAFESWAAVSIEPEVRAKSRAINLESDLR